MQNHCYQSKSDPAFCPHCNGLRNPSQQQATIQSLPVIYTQVARAGPAPRDGSMNINRGQGPPQPMMTFYPLASNAGAPSYQPNRQPSCPFPRQPARPPACPLARPPPQHPACQPACLPAPQPACQPAPQACSPSCQSADSDECSCTCDGASNTKRVRRRRCPRPCQWVVTHEMGVQTENDNQQSEDNNQDQEVIIYNKTIKQETEVVHRTGDREIMETEKQSLTKFMPDGAPTVTEVTTTSTKNALKKSGGKVVTEVQTVKETRTSDLGTSALAGTENVLASIDPNTDPQVVESMKSKLRANVSHPATGTQSPVSNTSTELEMNTDMSKYDPVRVVKTKNNYLTSRASSTRPSRQHTPRGSLTPKVQPPLRKRRTASEPPSRRRPSILLVSTPAPYEMASTPDDLEEEIFVNRQANVDEDAMSTVHVKTTKIKEATMTIEDEKGDLQDVTAVVVKTSTAMHVKRPDDPPSPPKKQKKKKPDMKMKYGYPSNDLVCRMERKIPQPRHPRCSCARCGFNPFACNYCCPNCCEPVYGRSCYPCCYP
ncbi:hypothetical protein KR018_007347 [Drosophila ironensis]|nr:hypothetical protein KR018_007347 [Drosophila ironensis]